MFHLLQITGLALVTATAVPTTPVTVEAGSQGIRAESGLQVVIDPMTGQIVDNPTAARLDRVEEGIDLERRRSAWELREFWLPEGGRGVYLDGWADHSLRVEIAPDGQTRFVCAAGDRHDLRDGPAPGVQGKPDIRGDAR